MAVERELKVYKLDDPLVPGVPGFWVVFPVTGFWVVFAGAEALFVGAGFGAEVLFVGAGFGAEVLFVVAGLGAEVLFVGAGFGSVFGGAGGASVFGGAGGAPVFGGASVFGAAAAQAITATKATRVMSLIFRSCEVR